ncbi:oxidoreductase protein [Apiospora marii]|uniref:Oxidoreductase protein n=1 Tax=Apiospora marii TaxID=335849 RepID=A0ABR1RSP5_9PEZI
MEGPPDNPRICSIARKVSPLPPELIGPIIAEQQLHRVLELSLVPTAGPSLCWAIKNCLQWKWLFVRQDGTNQIGEFQRLFKSINLLSWTWCRQVTMLVPAMAKRYHLHVDSGSKATSLKQLQEQFLSVFLDFIPVPERQQRLRGLHQEEFESLARYLPDNILTRIKSMETPGTMRILALEECMKSKHSTTEFASSLVSHDWTVEQAQNFLPYLAQALKLQGQAKSQELFRLADLYEVFPAELKEPFAPQEARNATQHIVSGLRRDAARMLTKPPCTYGKVHREYTPTSGRFSYRFRYPHPTLVPADWVLRLLCLTLERYPLPEDGDSTESEGSRNRLNYPPELLSDLRQCAHGLPHILQYSGISVYARYTQFKGPSFNVAHVNYLKKTEEASPHSYTELDWLEALLRCVSWIKGEAPELVQECLQIPLGKTSADNGVAGTKYFSTWKPVQLPGPTPLLDYAPLLTKEDYEAYIAGESAEVIAEQLRLDSLLSSGDLDRLPSLLALYLPRIPEGRSRDIAAYLLPEADRSVRELMYKDMVKSARAAIQKSPITNLTYEESNGHTSQRLIGDDTTNLSAEETWEAYHDYAAFKTGRVAGPSSYCYVCQMWLKQAHKVFPRMCEPCGDFNIAGSEVSLPSNLKLDGKVALVTGGRINLGFHTALRLLRCGASVIVSTRYPEDAVTRYENESDASVWKGRLKVIGADFRSAGDAFQLVKQVQNLVEQMGVCCTS